MIASIGALLAIASWFKITWGELFPIAIKDVNHSKQPETGEIDRIYFTIKMRSKDITNVTGIRLTGASRQHITHNDTLSAIKYTYPTLEERLNLNKQPDRNGYLTVYVYNKDPQSIKIAIRESRHIFIDTDNGLYRKRVRLTSLERYKNKQPVFTDVSDTSKGKIKALIKFIWWKYMLSEETQREFSQQTITVTTPHLTRESTHTNN